jgi:hypothetical protein
VKRIIAAAALAALVATPAVGHAAKPRRVERKVSIDYTGFCQAGTTGTSTGISGCPIANEIEDAARRGESYVKVSAVDDSGLVVGIVTYNPDAFAGSTTYLCGKSAKPMKIKSGRKLGVKTIADPMCDGVPTTGTLTMVFSNLP